MSSEAYERERQNNARLSELSSKVSALRGVTVDIYNNASDQSMIERNQEVFSNMGTSIKNSSQRLGRMAKQGNKTAILKLAGIMSGVVILLWWVGGWFLSGKGKEGKGGKVKL
ncbi:blocked early in transport 1 [Venturia nashicola]|uniref:Blocked early in transport 1 n=1 Tax=Venturia nashicola TaxID=86259 RepID=A0A4Z1NEV6_9PEZI|nr:blocked early in transport 1 [Venturia nashicola]TLD15021.1 blocked early in transport 1 [Venturia nashicola]